MSFKNVLAIAFCRNILSLCFCYRVIPSSIPLTLAVPILSRSLAKFSRCITAVVLFFISLKSSFCLSFNFHFVSFLKNGLLRVVCSECLDRNFAIDSNAPRNDFNLLLDIGCFMSTIAFIPSFCSLFFFHFFRVLARMFPPD